MRTPLTFPPRRPPLGFGPLPATKPFLALCESDLPQKTA